MISIDLVRHPSQQWPRLGHGAAKQQTKKMILIIFWKFSSLFNCKPAFDKPANIIYYYIYIPTTWWFEKMCCYCDFAELIFFDGLNLLLKSLILLVYWVMFCRSIEKISLACVFSDVWSFLSSNWVVIWRPSLVKYSR